MFVHQITEARTQIRGSAVRRRRPEAATPCGARSVHRQSSSAYCLAAKAEVRLTALPTTNGVTNIVALGDNSKQVLRRTPARPVSQSAPGKASATPTIWPADDEIQRLRPPLTSFLHCRDLANTLSVSGTIEHAYRAWLAAIQYRKYDPKDTRYGLGVMMM